MTRLASFRACCGSKAKDPVLNAIAGELAYLIAPISRQCGPREARQRTSSLGSLHATDQRGHLGESTGTGTGCAAYQRRRTRRSPQYAAVESLGPCAQRHSWGNGVSYRTVRARLEGGPHLVRAKRRLRSSKQAPAGRTTGQSRAGRGREGHSKTSAQVLAGKFGGYCQRA